MFQALFIVGLAVGVTYVPRAAAQTPHAAARPVVMLTGYWAPTGDMIRPFSRNPGQNPNWIGENWEGRGYDVQSYFPEFPEGSGSVGVGDFEVERQDTLADFNRITSEIHPIAIVSFGQGAGPWEIETNAVDYEHGGPTLPNTLPADEIASAVNALGELRAWVDREGDAGAYLCGFLSWLGADYHARHSDRTDPAPNLAQGFIHVEDGLRPEFYRHAVDVTLRALIARLDAGLKNEAPKQGDPQPRPVLAWPTLSGRGAHRGAR